MADLHHLAARESNRAHLHFVLRAKQALTNAYTFCAFGWCSGAALTSRLGADGLRGDSPAPATLEVGYSGQAAGESPDFFHPWPTHFSHRDRSE